MKKYAAVALLLALVVMVILPVPVYAIAEPDTAPQVSAAYVYEFDDGSIGVLIDYYLDYDWSAVPTGTPVPDETATEAYLAVFYDTVTSAQWKSVAPYTFVASGYGRGLTWIRFTAAEVAAYGISSADIANYQIWLVGNPALTWTPGPDPPKTIASIDQWNDEGDMDVLLALRVLYYADVLELAWTLDMVESTSDGNKLTTTGESYFVNVVADLRTLAPACFSAMTKEPSGVDVDYDPTFSATATSGTADIVGSPVTLAEGSNTINVTSTGSIIIALGSLATGNVTDGTGTMTGSPVDLYPGTNTLTVTGAGTFTIELQNNDEASIRARGITGTGMDLTAPAAAFGMSRWMFSGLVWVIVSVVVVAAFYRQQDSQSPGKGAFVLFGLMAIGGTLLGLLHPLVSALLIIAAGAFIGYVLFFQSETLHKGFMFMIWMFLIVCIAGSISTTGQSAISATRLTDAVTSTDTTSIAVQTTVGFPDYGTVIIEDETIRYPRKDDTHLLGTAVVNPIVRGAEGTTAAAHAEGASVRTKESWMLNASIDYKIARIVDSAGALDFIAMPLRLLDLVGTFFVLPLQFFGTDLVVLTYIWMVVAMGMIVGFVVALAGGRRV